ncbi:MAG: peptide-methionine (R)-S-oxide reductase MsrB [Flavobacteriaceae bacterium]|uniref:peptide-methionine (R)-S-oxide reductase MsrB n=1 Tax=Gelidibacter japonicus TaxID=1962232 RepID=UPI001DE170D4|nr:peptide-methionine (R)-S-oxide reductase MsrB [Flavobacteriaceae bacterium]
MEDKTLTWKDVIHFATKGNLEPDTRVEKTEAKWREILTPEQFRITRQAGTEAPHTGALCSRYDAGVYNCVCCNTPLFDSTIKFNSGTGWPSFSQPIKNNVIKYIKDSSFGMVRVEVQCSTCDAHQGHVFPDGPEPSGLRYCINSGAMVMQTEDETKEKETN